PQLELWCGRADRRSRRSSAADPADEKLPGYSAAVAWRTDAPCGRRGETDSGRQQQCVQPEQRDELVRLDANEDQPGDAAIRAADYCVSQDTSRVVATDLLYRRHRGTWDCGHCLARHHAQQ